MRVCMSIAERYAFVGDKAFPRGREKLRAALAFALPPREQEEAWMPIATAPKDGNEFLAIYGRQGNVMQIIKWNALHGFWQSKGEPEIGFTSNATGWQPLPAPPSLARTQGA